MATNTLSQEQRQRLLECARAAMRQAYAPYSNLKVGAALLTMDGYIFAGCNIENASYGLTNCAERTAIFSAVAQNGPGLTIRAITVLNNRDMPCSPCGACRQVIYQFGPKARVIFLGVNGFKELPISELLPEGFRLH